jgi:hypothetical protein
VHLDGYIEVEAAYYGAPPGWIGRRVQVQWNTAQVRLIDPLTGQLLREHLRQQRGRHRIQEQDRPERTPSSTQQLPHRVAIAEAHMGALCQALHQRQGEMAVRRILGVLALAKKYGVAATDDACVLALETGTCEYRFVRRYLERNPQLPLSLGQVDPLNLPSWTPGVESPLPLHVSNQSRRINRSFLRAHELPHALKFVHTPSLLVVLNEMNAGYRQAFTDGRPVRCSVTSNCRIRESECHRVNFRPHLQDLGLHQ